MFSRELNKSKNKIDSLKKDTSLNLKTLSEKVKTYEETLLKYEKRYPWLESSKLKLTDMAKNIDNLNELKNEKIKLQEELEEFHGLSPDLCKAQEQLREMINRNNKLKSYLYDHKST